MIEIVNKPDIKTLLLFGFILLPILYLGYKDKFLLSFYLVLIIMLFFSIFEIPIPGYSIRTRKPNYKRGEAQILSEIYSIPLEKDLFQNNARVFNTIITLNIGGFVVPILFSLYLIVSNPNTALAALEILMIMVVATHLLSEIKAGIGIIVPTYIGLLAIPFVYILAPNYIASVMFISSVTGILIGIVSMLFTINESTYGSARINLGGTGSFKAVYVASLISILIYLKV
ncbi:MAG: DUF1614 domain-containing protein [Methanosarcinales archaeon]